MDRVTCASPDYIAKFGEPSHPEELRGHNCLLHKRDGHLFSNWEYMTESRNYKINVNSNKASNDTDIVRRWATHGKGIAYRAKIDVLSDLRSGKLVQILSSYRSPSVELHLVCASRKQVSPAVIELRELLRYKISKKLKH